MSEPPVLLFVNGTLMCGLELHDNLDGAEFIETTRTARLYRLHSIDDIHPGMYQVEEGGVSVEGELYSVPAEVWRRVEAVEPSGLYRGSVWLEDGRVVLGILFPREAARPTQQCLTNPIRRQSYDLATSPFGCFEREVGTTGNDASTV